MGHGLAQQVYGRLPKNLGINMEMIIAHFLWFCTPCLDVHLPMAILKSS
jgi:hypothetical protein